MEITLGQLAALLGGQLEGPPERAVSDIKGITEAGPTDLTFLANPKYAKALSQCRAGVVLVSREQKTPEGLAVIRVDNPYLAFAKVLTMATKKPHRPLGVHERAVVDPQAKLGAEVSIHALAHVCAGAEIGDRVVLHPGVYVGENAKVGADTVLHPNVVIEYGCQVGERCIIHAGTVIGSDGFGYVPDGQRYFKIPQVGIVQIDDDVELGANVCVDRAATGRTWIQRGAKIDNLVQIAHNCVIGEDTVLVSQVGIAGSTKVGNHVVMAGQVGISGHLQIGDNATIGPKTGVARSVPAGQTISAGIQPQEQHAWARWQKRVLQVPEMYDRIKELEKELAALKGSRQGGGS